MLLSAIVVQSAETALISQLADGSMPAGHNGPWGGWDTRVRTSAHWSQVFLKAFQLTGATKWKTAALRCCDFLISQKSLSPTNVFRCRVGLEAWKRPNGLIGQAWALEALIGVGTAFGREDFLERAGQAVSRHTYHTIDHGWRLRLTNGRETRLDPTINQQIWFALMADKLSVWYPQGGQNSADFFKNLETKVVFIQPGVISHLSSDSFKNPRPRSDAAKQIVLSMGYQSFILFGLFSYFQAKKKVHTEYSFLSDALSFSLNRDNDELYRANPYCYGYNVTGIELAFVAECLGDRDSASWWLNRQFAHTYGGNLRFLSRNISDSVLVPSRIYEALRLRDDYEINLP